MIAPAEQSGNTDSSSNEKPPSDHVVLARYGRVPQVARFSAAGAPPDRDCVVVVQTERGEELATVLHSLPQSSSPGEAAPELTGRVLRIASDSDLLAVEQSLTALERSFDEWVQRTVDWQLQLQLIDLETTLDGRLILYVLNDRGAETTRLALLAAAAGCGIVHVQPVSADGIVQQSGGGCGSGGCGTGGCSPH